MTYKECEHYRDVSHFIGGGPRCASRRRKQYLKIHYEGPLPNCNYKGEGCKFFSRGYQATLDTGLKSNNTQPGGDNG